MKVLNMFSNQEIQTVDEQGWDKIPQLTILFWVMKITATTFGETGGDFLAQTLNIGYDTSTIIFLHSSR